MATPRRRGGGGAEGSPRRRAHSCSAGRARRVTGAGEGDRQQGRLCAFTINACTINKGDPYVAVAQPVYLARHQGGAVHILVVASFHGLRTSVALRAQVTSKDARPWPLKNRVLTTAVSSSSSCIPCGRVAGGEGGVRDLGLRHLGAGVVGSM